MNYRRICLVGGAGCRKSTLAHWIFNLLKENKLNVEMIQEPAKELTFTDSKPISFDQFILFSKQIGAEDKRLRKNIKLTISDTSDFLAICYGKKNKMAGWETLIPFHNVFNKKYPALTLFVERVTEEYEQNGRFENLDESKDMDKLVLSMLKKHKVKHVKVKANDKKHIIEVLNKNLKIKLKS